MEEIIQQDMHRESCILTYFFKRHNFNFNWVLSVGTHLCQMFINEWNKAWNKKEL